MDEAILIILAFYVAASILGYIIHLIEFKFFNKDND
jgi:hypothetical protein